MAESPRGKHNSKAFNNSWKNSTLRAFGGKCCVCFEQIIRDEYVVLYKSSRKICHTRCADGKPRKLSAKSIPPGVVKHSNVNEEKISRDVVLRTFPLIVGNADCSVCKVSRGTPCKNSATKWIHKVRVDKFEKQHD